MKANLHYRLILSWSDEDGAIIAEAPELPGCAADGQTYEEALANVQVVIADWIVTAERLGRPVPRPGSAGFLEGRSAEATFDSTSE